ncbi:hypothetical protein N2152v2_005771 [Parachlorella kessleri]
MNILRKAVSGLLRAARPNGDYEISEVSDVLYWLRMLLALAAGIACGITGAQGLLTFIGFIVVCTLGGTMWLKYQDIDTEDFPEDKPIATEGLPPSVAFFLAARH